MPNFILRIQFPRYTPYGNTEFIYFLILYIVTDYTVQTDFSDFTIFPKDYINESNLPGYIYFATVFLF